MIKKLILLLLVVCGGVVSANAATETTVYYAIPSNIVNNYDVKLNVNFKGDGDDWHQFEMTKTDKTYMGFPIYTCTYTDAYDGVGRLQFQLYDGDTQKWNTELISSWPAVSVYNGKMFVHGTENNDKFVDYSCDDTNLLHIVYHIKKSDNFTPSYAYEYKGNVNNHWPGSSLLENTFNDEWYDFVVQYPFEYIIFNNGNSGNGNQTGNIQIDNTSNEYWITYTVNGNEGTTEFVEKPENWIDYQRQGLTEGNLGTICLPFDATIDGATAYKIVNKTTDGANLTGLYVDRVQTLEAGKSYIFKATSNTLTATYSGSYKEASEDYGMMGNLSSTSTTVPNGNYVINGNKIRKVNGGTVTIGQYRAYITLTGIGEATNPAPGLTFIGTDGETTSIEGLEIETNQDAIYNLNGQRTNDLKKGLYIINGKKILVK